MAYDTADGYVILFGGASAGSSIFIDTWKFLGGSWTNITSTSGPSPRFIASMAYDAADGYVILFGGISSSNVFSDTWKFLGGSWTNITSTSGPSPRFIASMAYDAADGYVILFGGISSSNVFSDTWKFHGGSWTNITPSSSPALDTFPSMAYDAADGYVILFSGLVVSSSHVVGETWKYLGGSWTNITSSTGPPQRDLASMVYDAADGYVILFGGATYVASGNHFFGDTWKFSSTGTPPPFDYSLSNNGPVIITQGTSVTLTVAAKLTAGSALPVTLSCVGSSLPSGITCGSFTVNPVTSTTAGATSGLTVSVASSVTPGSYLFTVTGSPARANASASTTTVTVNVSTPGPWTNITPSTSPSPQFAASMAYDAADG